MADKLPWATICLALGTSIAAIVTLLPVARRTGWVDKPNPRKSHEGDVPLIGGWAILLSIAGVQVLRTGGAIAPTGYWVGALSLFVIALLDDRYPIRARYRFIVQIVAGIAGISMGGQSLASLGDLFGTGPIATWWLVTPISVLGIVAVINAVNFTDGADGLCGGLGFISLFWLLFAMLISANLAANVAAPTTTYSSSMVPLAAATMGGVAGFLLFNMRSPWLSKATVFLGDSGSMLIGFTLGWLAIHVTTAYGNYSVSPVTCLWILAVPLFDGVSCILRRVLAGVTPMTPDLKHLHHLIRRAGLTTGQSVMTICASSFFFGFVGVAGWWLGIPEHRMFMAFVVTLLVFVVLSNWAWKRIDKDDLSTSHFRDRAEA